MQPAKHQSRVIYVRVTEDQKADFVKACDLCGTNETNAARQLIDAFIVSKLGQRLIL